MKKKMLVEWLLRLCEEKLHFFDHVNFLNKKDIDYNDCLEILFKIKDIKLFCKVNQVELARSI